MFNHLRARLGEMGVIISAELYARRASYFAFHALLFHHRYTRDCAAPGRARDAAHCVSRVSTALCHGLGLIGDAVVSDDVCM